MSVPVGITVPKLLPITATFTPLFAGYFSFLSLRTVAQRGVHRTNFGLPEKASNPAVAPDSLTLMARCHQNFAENVPLALILAGLVELNGGNRKVLTGALAALFAMRVAHVEIGMLGKDTVGIGRPIGYFGTIVWILGAGGYAAYLVKGYWGL